MNRTHREKYNFMQWSGIVGLIVVIAAGCAVTTYLINNFVANHGYHMPVWSLFPVFAAQFLAVFFLFGGHEI